MSTVVYVSNADSGDIAILSMTTDGTLAPLGTAEVGGTVMPLAVSPCRRFLYAARRSEPMAVVSFAIDPIHGTLCRLGEAPLPASMAYIATDRSGRWLFAASYQGDVVTVSPIAADGRAGPVRQSIATGRHAHAILPAPSNRHVLATSLGGGVVMQFAFDAASGRLTPNVPAALTVRPGAGPRHLRFHPNGRLVYLLNELDASVDVLGFDADTGTLAPLQTVDSLPPGFEGEPWAADLQLTPDGRFLYASERRSSTLAAFRIDADSGRLALVGHVPTETQPRGFAIDSRGHWLLAVGQLSDRLSRYAIDPVSGALASVQRIEVGRNPNWVEIVDLPAP
ncbi:lactonase family protein [Thauera humireducens]|uniref:lactonase family protein n=1 Tax=Thauera humireducens TaxID=1134435 RepID=UPI00311E500F